MTMTHIKKHNARIGHHWFEQATLRFFRSRIGRKVYTGPGGVFFVSSEQFELSAYVAPRRYTVRQYHPDTGAIDTVGPFNERSRYEAVRDAKSAAAG